MPKPATTKLEPEQVMQIRCIRAYTSLTNREIAEEFHISSSHVANLGVHRFWPEVGGPYTYKRGYRA